MFLFVNIRKYWTSEIDSQELTTNSLKARNRVIIKAVATERYMVRIDKYIHLVYFLTTSSFEASSFMY